MAKTAAPAVPNTDQLRLERQKLALEVLVKRRELREKRSSLWRDVFSNPLSIAVVGGLVTLLANAVGTYLSTRGDQELERLKAELQQEQASKSVQADLIKRLAEAPDVATARTNLQFLVDAGLVPDYEARIKAYLAANPDNAPVVNSSFFPDFFGKDDRKPVQSILASAGGSERAGALRPEVKRLLGSVGEFRYATGDSNFICNTFRIRQDLILVAAFCAPAGITNANFVDQAGRIQMIRFDRRAELGDFVAYQLMESRTDDAYLPLSNEPPVVGTPLMSAFYTTTTGWVAVGTDAEACTIQSVEDAQIIEDCDAGAGSSGAPLLASDGKVVGVFTMTSTTVRIAARVDTVAADPRLIEAFGSLPAE